MVSEEMRAQTERQILSDHFYTESGKKRLIERYIILAVTRVGSRGGGQGIFDLKVVKRYKIQL